MAVAISDYFGEGRSAIWLVSRISTSPKGTAHEKGVRLSGTAYRQDFDEKYGGDYTLPSYMVEDRRKSFQIIIQKRGKS